MADEDNREVERGPLTGQPWDVGWLRHSSWIAQRYPGFVDRERRVFAGVTAGCPPPSELLEIAFVLVSRRRRVPGLGRLADYVRSLRQRYQEPRLLPLELWATMSAAAKHHWQPNPFVHAIDAVPWSCVPASHVEMAIDIGLLVRAWAHADSSRPNVPMLPQEEDATPRREDEKRLARSHYGAEVFDGPDFTLYREIVEDRGDGATNAALVELAAFAEQVVGTEPSRERGRGPSTSPREVAGTVRLLDIPSYVQGMLERLPRTAPAAFALYGTVADTAPPELALAVEHVAEQLVSTVGDDSLRAEVELRTAVRRVVGSRVDEAIMRGIEAFRAASACGDRAAECLAACLVGDQLNRDGRHDAASWLERAWDRAESEGLMLRAELLRAQIDAYERAGDESGRRRVVERGRALVERHGPLEPLMGWIDTEPVVAAIFDEQPEPTPRPSLPRFLEPIERLLDQERHDEASEAVAEYVAELIDTCSLHEVERRLVALVAQLDEHYSVVALLAEAIADLVEDDHARWCEYKRMQLRVEDRRMFGAWRIVCRDGQCFRVYDAVTARQRVMLCNAHGEDALERGRPEQARFWVEQAQRYRAT